jgi:Flp pilus assembly protein TadG
MVSRRRTRSESGVSLFLGIVSLLFIIPLVGLSIDVGVLYVVKARLQASVDGASLAAARALNLGASTTAQASSAKQNAVNWFYANFPNGNWGTFNTVMDQTTVNVFDDPNNPQVRNVTVSATTTAPTYFMKWMRFESVVLAATGNASRRDVVVMMVLDRSGSMQNAGACGDMINAAKVFTGQFAAGRDRIGLVSYSDNYYLHSAPTTNFRTVLGYTNASGSANGAIDTITCAGGTSTAQAISVAYNELYKTNLPGALNVLMFETDGLPNTLTMNFWDSSTSSAGISNGSTCKDVNNKTVSGGGFRTEASLPSWTTPPTLGSGSFFPAISNKIVGAVATDDPGGSNGFFLMLNYWTSSASYNFNSTSYLTTTTAPGCYFTNSSYHHDTSPNDIAWFPATDVWGNQAKPANAYAPVTLSGGHVSVSWANYHNAVLNATDNAAYRARTNPNIPAYFFGVGLGGTVVNPPDYILMQRMANDPREDQFNTPPRYQACSQEPNCVTYDNQPQGTFLFSSNASQLGQAFLSISSQILRLSK